MWPKPRQPYQTTTLGHSYSYGFFHIKGFYVELFEKKSLYKSSKVYKSAYLILGLTNARRNDEFERDSVPLVGQSV